MKILIVGNCQARPVAEILKLASDKVEIVGKLIVHLAKNEDALAHEKLYEEADVILAQQVVSNYPVEHVTTDYIKTKYADKVVTWVNVFFQGQNPDLFYVTSESGNRIVGPIDVYHSRALIDLWKQGVSAQDINQASYISDMYSVEDLLARVTKSLADLKNREANVDISMHDFISENWQSKLLFHTFNHPNITTVLELCDRVCRHVGIPVVDSHREKLPDHLSLIIPPVEQTMAKNLGMNYALSTDIHGLEVSEDKKAILPGKRTIYSFAEFSSIAFSCYDAQRESLQNVRYTPA